MSPKLLWLISLLILVGSAQAQDVNVGVVYSFSGAAQTWSEYGRKGLELAREEVNASGGVNGKMLNLLYEDSRTNPAQSVSAYRKLVATDKVQFVIGNVWSFLTNPLIPLAARDQVVLVSPTVMDASVEKPNEYFYTLGNRMESLRAPLNRFFEINPDVKTVALLCWEDAWGRAHVKLWREVAAQHGATITDELCQNDFANDFRTDVTKVSGKHPDAIFVSMYVDRVLQRMREQNVQAKILGTSDLMEGLRMRQAPASLLQGTYFTDWRPSEDFISKFKAKYGEEPVLEAHNHYEALRAIAQALRSSNRHNRTSLQAIHYQGVAGPIDFRTSPFANHGPGQLYQLQPNGSPKPQ